MTFQIKIAYSTTINPNNTNIFFPAASILAKLREGNLVDPEFCEVTVIDYLQSALNKLRDRMEMNKVSVYSVDVNI